MVATEGDPWRKFGTLTNIAADVIGGETCSGTAARVGVSVSFGHGVGATLTDVNCPVN